MRAIALVVISGLLLAAAESAAVYTIDGERKSFEIYRTDTPPVIDGKLDDAAWDKAAFIDDFHQTVPVDGAASITPSTATVGDPLTLTVTLTRPADLEIAFRPGMIRTGALVETLPAANRPDRPSFALPRDREA